MLLYSASSVLPTGTNGTHTNEHVSIRDRKVYRKDVSSKNEKKIKNSLSELIFWKNFDRNWSCFLATCF